MLRKNISNLVNKTVDAYTNVIDVIINMHKQAGENILYDNNDIYVLLHTSVNIDKALYDEILKEDSPKFWDSVFQLTYLKMLGMLNCYEYYPELPIVSNVINNLEKYYGIFIKLE